MVSSLPLIFQEWTHEHSISIPACRALGSAFHPDFDAISSPHCGEQNVPDNENASREASATVLARPHQRATIETSAQPLSAEAADIKPSRIAHDIADLQSANDSVVQYGHQCGAAHKDVGQPLSSFDAASPATTAAASPLLGPSAPSTCSRCGDKTGLVGLGVICTKRHCACAASFRVIVQYVFCHLLPQISHPQFTLPPGLHADAVNSRLGDHSISRTCMAACQPDMPAQQNTRTRSGRAGMPSNMLCSGCLGNSHEFSMGNCAWRCAWEEDHIC